MDGPLIPLARGATGFWTNGGTPLPSVDVVASRTACQAAARSIRGRVARTSGPGTARSFHTATITAAHGGGTVLCHGVLPAVAFTASPPRAGAPVTGFVRPPSWADPFAAAGFRLLEVAELTAPLAPAHTGGLGEAELSQVRHWNPGTAGELMFNWWD
ncbi:hypothetical protein [Streptomyces fructofermentans]|uniref:hypothetical protein n=1 Tax=Streptomyces fructofermentans TaxID=152141 RepID=UPI0037B8FA6F